MPVHTAGVQILIADDLEMIRDGLRLLLTSRQGWNICAEAADGLDAVEKSLHLRPDVAVLDLNLPAIGGLEASRRIRAVLPRTEIMIVAHKNNESLKQTAFDAGATGFMLKTNLKHQLLSAVESLIQHKPFFPIETSPTAPIQPYPEPDVLKAGPGEILLTGRERQIVRLVAEGRTSKEVGAALGCSFKTVEAHRASVMKKLRVRTLSDLVRYAVRSGIVTG
jgi:DNA-binding NarL/FixJ family response regulator